MDPRIVLDNLDAGVALVDRLFEALLPQHSRSCARLHRDNRYFALSREDFADPLGARLAASVIIRRHLGDEIFRVNP